VTAITVACILIYYLDKTLPMACNRQSSSCDTHSLTQLDSIVAYASIGSKLQKLTRPISTLFNILILCCYTSKLVDIRSLKISVIVTVVNYKLLVKPFPLFE